MALDKNKRKNKYSDMVERPVKIFPIERFQTTRRPIALKTLDHEEPRSTSI